MKKNLFLLIALFNLIIGTSFIKKDNPAAKVNFCGGGFYVNNTTGYSIDEVTMVRTVPYSGLPDRSIFDIDPYSVVNSPGSVAGDYSLEIKLVAAPAGGLYFRVWNKVTNTLLDCFKVTASPFRMVGLNEYYVDCLGGLLEIEVSESPCR
ncbi:hypothetical protein ACFS6H_11095 [Terrimonas rubra]|uniref:Uncharacterized protein n=1 Tax=Terrimonas rubra TaxID=1035890 RepID=A0ABW6A567_9BACT